MVLKPILDPFKGLPTMLSMHQAQSVGCEGVYWKNPSPTMVRDSAKIQYISGGQPPPYEPDFGVKLGTNPHSKNYHGTLNRL